MPHAKMQNGHVAKWSGIRAWLRKRRLLLASIVVAAFIVLFVFPLPVLLVRPRGAITAAERLEAENAVRSTLLQALGGAVVLVGVYFTARTFDLNRQGQVTDRFTRAIDQLGQTESLDVRIGGIYALERIARDSRDDHGPVLEVLTAYVRGHSPRRPDESAFPDESAANEGSISADVQAALTVLGRRNPEYDPPRDGKRGLDLSGTNLTKANLRGANLEGANLRTSVLAKGILRDVNLQGANLRWANLTGASLPSAMLLDAFLMEVNLEQANLPVANLERANLERANLGGANVRWANLRGANLQGANLQGANLQGANLRGANLRGASLVGANLEAATPEEAKHRPAFLPNDAADLTDAEFDAETKWPEGFDALGRGARSTGTMS